MVGDLLQPTHLLFVLVVALLVLGPKRLPEVAKTLGKGLRDFRGAINGDTDDDDDDPRATELTPYVATADEEPHTNGAEAEHTVSDADHSMPEAEHTVSDADHTVPDADHTVPDAEHTVPEAEHAAPAPEHTVPTGSGPASEERETPVPAPAAPKKVPAPVAAPASRQSSAPEPEQQT